MNEILQSFLIGTLGLAGVLLAAVILAVFRTSPTAEGLAEFRNILLAAIGLHAIHFTEEAAYGFHVLFPSLLGLAPWPLSLFLGFNQAWVVLWLAALIVLPLNRFSVVLFWFLGIASLLNGIAHPLLALAVGGYFPGLVTSPLVGILGLVLVRGLYRATSSPNQVTLGH